MNVLIIGGSGEFGSFYAALLKKNGFNVSITSSNKEECKKFAIKKGLVFFDENYSNIDTVIISTPNAVAPKIVNDISPKLKKGTLLFDFCSVKSRVFPEIEKLIDKGLELASIHPMHGPDVASIKGQNVILIPIEVGKKYSEIRKFFEKEGANCFDSTAIEHDKILSVVQGLTQMTQLTAAKTIEKLEINFKITKKFSSPNYMLLVKLIENSLPRPLLYSQILTENIANKDMRKAFEEASKEVIDACNGDWNKTADFIINTANKLSIKKERN